MAQPNAHHGTDGDSALRRERGMHRVSNATRWTVAAAAAGTAALGLTYTHLLPGKAPGTASTQGGQQTACVQRSPAVAAPAAAQATGRETDDGDKREEAADDGSRNTTTVQPTVTACPGGTAANGLTPPAQPPSPAQQAPQTRTGAS